jgi:diguanylate cyclase (GGDEF)-like protein
MQILTLAIPQRTLGRPARPAFAAAPFLRDRMADELLRTLESKLRLLDAVNAIGKLLTGSLDLREVLATVINQIRELLQPRSCSLLLVDEATGEMVFELAVGDGAEKILKLRLKQGEGIAGWAATKRQSVLVKNVLEDPRFAARFDKVSGTQTHSLIAVPLIARGRILGVIELVNGLVDRPFVEEDVQLVEMLAEFAAIGIDNARSYKQVQELTILDEHTSLYNARFLHRTLDSEVERARRFAHPLSLIFFDLDHFKQVNDTHGHSAGTALLAEVGDLVVGSLRTVDVPVRYGGDEFVVVLPETLKKAAIDVASRLQTALARYEFLRTRGLAVHVTGSFGVASFPEDAKNAEDLLKAADQAMYKVKGAHRDGIAAAGWGLMPSA